MPAIQDKQRKTWIAQFYYVDYTGQKKRKRKRGFKYKKDALQFERDFLQEHSQDVTMRFSNFCEVYLDDVENRIRESSYELKKYLIETKLIPYFKDMPLSEISPLVIRNWQNDLLSYRDENDNTYSPTYLKSISSQLSAIFNYAVKYHNLKENPCVKAGSLGKCRADEMHMWTTEEFQLFLRALGDNKEDHSLALKILFFSGLRIGELLALTPSDINLELQTISVTKTYRRHNRKDIITPPKTKKSLREVTIPSFLTSEIENYIFKNNIRFNKRIFTFTSSALSYTVKKYSEMAGIDKIRLHDFRHSHASLLIDMGFNPNLVADRLGHEKIETTLNIYSHLYPSKRLEVADKLEDLNQKICNL